MRVRISGAARTGGIVVVLVCSACGERIEQAPTAESGWSGQVRDSAGITVVSNPATGVWTDQTRWTVHRDLVVGAGPTEAPEYEFGSVADVDAGADGRIYVLDNQAGQVSVFEPDGRFAFSFGKLGKGPGEFSIEAFAIRIDSDGTVEVRDGINHQDNVFTGDGAFLRTAPLAGPFRESAALPQGGRIERTTTPAWDGLVHVGSDGSILDTVTSFRYDLTKRGGALSSAGRTGNASRTEIPLLPSLPSWAVARDGRVLSGISSRYRIEVRKPDGTLEMVIDRDHDSLAMGSEAGDRMLDRVRELLRDAGLSEQAVGGVFSRFSYVPPDSLPVFADIVGGPAGTIWVQQVLPVDSMTANATIDALNPGSADWDAFCGDGRYLGQVTLPRSFTLMRIRESSIYGIETDELGVQRVMRLSIRPGSAASKGVQLSC